MLSSVFAILYANRPGRPPSRYQKHRRDDAVAEILGEALDRGARDAMPVEPRRVAPDDMADRHAPGLQPAAVAAPARRRRHAGTDCAAPSVSRSSAPRSARRTAGRGTAPGLPSRSRRRAPTSTSDRQNPALAARPLGPRRPVELALEKGDRPPGQRQSGCGTKRNTPGISPNSASIARPASSSSSGSSREGGLIAAAISALGRRRSIGGSELE